MATISVIELTLAVFFSLSFFGQLRGDKVTDSFRKIRICISLAIAWLIIDALSVSLTMPKCSYEMHYAINLLSYSYGNIVVISFVRYCNAYVKEKAEVNPWLYRVPVLLLLFCFTAAVVEFISGNIIVYEGGVPVAENYLPYYILATQIIVMLYMPIAAFTKRKEIGVKAVLLLGFFDFIPVVAAVIYEVTGVDLVVIFAAAELMICVSMLQRDSSRETFAQGVEQQALVQNFDRIFALEDDFESLYDVEIESGHYSSYVKGDFYRENVFSKLVAPTDFFKDLHSNIDKVVCIEDREELFKAMSRECISKALSENDRFEYYYRLMTEKGPCWFKLRVVYKDAEKKNIIVGVFNAEKDVEVRQLEEQKALLETENHHNTILNQINKSGAWTFRLNADDEVTDSEFSPEFIAVIGTEVKNVYEWLGLIHPEDSKMVVDEVHKCMSDKECKAVYDVNYRVMHEDGEFRWVHSAGQLRNLSNGEREFYGICSDIDEIVREHEKEQQLLKESLTFTNYFLDSFVSAYYVNLDDLTWQTYKRTDELEENYPITSDYFDSLTDYIKNDVHPDDRAVLLELANPENMRAHLEKEAQFSHIFRDISGGIDKTYRMQVIRGAEKDHAAFGFIDITAETLRRNELLKEAEETQKLIDSIASTYNIAYSVNLNTDSFRLIRMDDDIIGHDKEFNNFTEAKEFFLGIIPQSDEKTMRHELDYDVIRERLKAEKSYSVEYRVPIKGAIIWHEMNVTQIDDTHVVIAFAKKDVEITQKHLEDRRYNEYFALYEVDIETCMVKVVKDSPWYSIDRAGTATPFKPAMLQFADSLDGDAKEFFIRLADIEYAKKEFETEDKITFDYRSNNVGEKNWVECTSYVTLRNEDGSPAMFTLGFSMIDALGVFRQELQVKYKDALDAANEEKRRNDLLHDIIHSGMWEFTISADDQITNAYYSEEAMRIVNNDFSDDIKSWTDILHPDDAEEAIKAFTATVLDHSGNTPYDVTYRMADRNGVYHWFHSAGRVMRNADGTGEFFGIHIDITSQIEAQLEQQKQLEEARNAADEANKSKTNFLFNMSHDIRTPMNAIRGFTAIAKKHIGEEDKVTEYLEKIDISGDQLLRLINQVLEMARIEAGKIDFIEKPVNVADEFNSMVTIFSEQAKTNGIYFNHNINVEHNFVMADQARMGSITLNIVGNAMKYTPDGGHIRFELNEIPARKPGFATLVFTVEDTGIGMSEDYLKELFEPFTREKTSTVSKIQGTGLGMSIVKNLVDLLGGKIDVRSELGRGTRFDITIDFRISEGTEKGDEDEIVDPASFKGKRVLLVEDNEMNREIALDILDDYGLIAEAAEDGDIAVDMVKEHFDKGEYTYYDFILMDVQMPRMNGYEATRAIRALPVPEGVHVPIIAMTANAFEEDRKNAIAAGMDEHSAKPIDLQKLFKVLSKFL